MTGNEIAKAVLSKKKCGLFIVLRDTSGNFIRFTPVLKKGLIREMKEIGDRETGLSVDTKHGSLIFIE